MGAGITNSPSKIMAVRDHHCLALRHVISEQAPMSNCACKTNLLILFRASSNCNLHVQIFCFLVEMGFKILAWNSRPSCKQCKRNLYGNQCTRSLCAAQSRPSVESLHALAHPCHTQAESPYVRRSSPLCTRLQHDCQQPAPARPGDSRSPIQGQYSAISSGFARLAIGLRLLWWNDVPAYPVGQAAQPPRKRIGGRWPAASHQ